MGISDAIGSTMRRNMQTQMAFQRELILKQRQMQMATQLAMSRQRFQYYTYFYYTIVPLCVVGCIAKRNVSLLMPAIPLTFLYAFQYDLAYGSMLDRVRQQVDRLLIKEARKFYIPKHSGIVTVQEYERILDLKNGIKQQ